MIQRYNHRFSQLLLLALLLSTAGGCYTVTRVEREKYTVTQRDTTVRESAQNVPGERENGTVYPSSRQVEITRTYVQRDSTVERFYPAFLRYGGIEAASFIGTGGSTQGAGLGLFGLYDLLTIKRPTDTKTFTAQMYRFMPYEWRLRWFDDAPNWTFGVSAVEIFTNSRDSSAEAAPGERLVGIASPYFRKRFFLRDQPPYVMVVPFVGFGLLPSQYINLGATFDVGSFGGFNLRAYAGYISGTSAMLKEDSDPRNADYSVTFPYFGVGVSALDFVNKTDELFIEWKDHKHNAIEVNAVNFDMVYSTNTDAGSWFNPGTGSASNVYPTGFVMKIASANYPLPFADGNVFVGTSLFNAMVISKDEIALGWLPLRAGYRMNLMKNDLTLEPYAEAMYYPKTTIHLAARLSVKLPEWTMPLLNFPIPMRINAIAGFVDGSANSDVVTGFEDLIAPQDFSTTYVGFGIGIGDGLFTMDQVRKWW